MLVFIFAALNVAFAIASAAATAAAAVAAEASCGRREARRIASCGHARRTARASRLLCRTLAAAPSLIVLPVIVLALEVVGGSGHEEVPRRCSASGVGAGRLWWRRPGTVRCARALFITMCDPNSRLADSSAELRGQVGEGIVKAAIGQKEGGAWRSTEESVGYPLNPY